MVVTKQLSASLAISAEAGDILQMAGAFELARSCTACSLSPAAWLPSPMSTRSGLARPARMSPCAMHAVSSAYAYAYA